MNLDRIVNIILMIKSSKRCDGLGMQHALRTGEMLTVCWWWGSWRKCLLGIPGHIWEDNMEWMLKKLRGLDLFGWGQGHLIGSCECGNEPFGIPVFCGLHFSGICHSLD